MTELKPCPFCGSPVAFWHDIDFDPIGVQCSACKIAVRMLSVKKGKTYGDAMEQIAERWNRRARA